MPQTLVYKTSEDRKVGTTRWPLQVQLREICIRSLGNFVDHLEWVPWRKAYFQRYHLPRCSFLFQYEATLTSGPVDSTYIYTIPSVTSCVLRPLAFPSGDLPPACPEPQIFPDLPRCGQCILPGSPRSSPWPFSSIPCLITSLSPSSSRVPVSWRQLTFQLHNAWHSWYLLN